MSSTLITSAPRSPRIIVANGPDSALVRSSIRMPASGPGACTSFGISIADMLSSHGRPDLAAARRDRVEQVRQAYGTDGRPAHPGRRGRGGGAGADTGPARDRGRVLQPGAAGGPDRRTGWSDRRQAGCGPVG